MLLNIFKQIFALYDMTIKTFGYGWALTAYIVNEGEPTAAKHYYCDTLVVHAGWLGVWLDKCLTDKSCTCA